MLFALWACFFWLFFKNIREDEAKTGKDQIAKDGEMLFLLKSIGSLYVSSGHWEI